MTGIQGSMGGIDVMGAPRRRDADPLATLLAARQSRRPQPPRIDLRGLAERNVVPRLHARFGGLLRHAATTPICRPGKDWRHAVACFAEHLLANDHDGALAHIEALLDEGQALEWIFLHILAPAAARLHGLWHDDICGLAETALAMHNLTAVLRHFAPSFRAAAAPGAVQPGGHRQYRALFMGAPGAKVGAGADLFSLSLASEFLRRDGWEASIQQGLASRAMGDAVRLEWFDAVIIGRCERPHLDAIAAGIRSMRRVTRNSRLCIILHGPIFVENPGLVRQVDADFGSQDLQTSLIHAKQNVILPPRRAHNR